jgi:hypothetical protein
MIGMPVAGKRYVHEARPGLVQRRPDARCQARALGGHPAVGEAPHRDVVHAERCTGGAQLGDPERADTGRPRVLCGARRHADGGRAAGGHAHDAHVVAAAAQGGDGGATHDGLVVGVWGQHQRRATAGELDDGRRAAEAALAAAPPLGPQRGRVEDDGGCDQPPANGRLRWPQPPAELLLA